MTGPPPHGGHFTSAQSEVDADGIRVRGYPLDDLIRTRGFVESTYLTLRCELPGPSAAAVFDAVLCAIMSYPAVAGPNILAGRIAASVNPDPWVGIATALSCAGPHTISPQHTGTVLADALARCGPDPDDGVIEDVAAQVAAEIAETGGRLPGVGHPEFTDIDPRAAALLYVLATHGMAGPASRLHAGIVDAYNRARAPKRPLPLNVDGAMARALTELGFRPVQMYAVSLISFLPGIAAHVIEEIDGGTPFRMLPHDHETYTGPGPRPVPPREP